METKSYEQLIGDAHVIFEGHFVRYERYEFTKNGNTHKGLSMVYAVDKNWIGTKVGEEIKVGVWNPSVEKGGDLPTTPPNDTKAIFILDHKMSEKPEVLYGPGLCPPGIVPPDADEIRNLLHKGWPQAFYSIRGWMDRLI